MLDLIIQQRYYIAAIILFCIGIATLFIHPNLIKKIIGLNLMDTAVFLFLAAMGYVDGSKAPIIVVYQSRSRRPRADGHRGGCEYDCAVPGADLSAVSSLSQLESGHHPDSRQKGPRREEDP